MKKKCKWFEEEPKKEDIKPLKFARDALVLTAGVAVLGAGLSLLD